MLNTLSIAGASATAIALYITIHLLAAGALASPAHGYREASPVAVAALIRSRAQAGEGAQSASPRQSVMNAGRALNAGHAAPNILSGVVAAAFETAPRHLCSAALLTLISPRAP